MIHKQQQGGVSLFIVIFTTLIVTIITVSFTQMMVHTQQQATNNDLAQRAYDSAMAGVEDAKRGLVKLTQACATGGSDCTAMTTKVNAANNCTTLQDLGVSTFSNNEVAVGAANDNQAYTCVTIQLQTPTYKDSLAQDATAVIPLKATAAYDKITLKWFTAQDAGANNADQVSSPQSVSPALPPSGRWQTNSKTPPMMRVQYVPGSSKLSDLDTTAQTGFLYPVVNGLLSPPTILEVGRRTATILPQPINCQRTFSSSPDGVCTANITVTPNNNGYLILTSLYGSTHFTASMSSSSTPINFDGVQPLVDSTGRADNLFRRVQAKVKITNGGTIPYPNATVHVKNNLCKAFFVTDRASEYQSNTGTCDADRDR